MKWIGLTGPIGSGKSLVKTLLEAKGLKVLSADEMAQKIKRQEFFRILQELKLSFIKDQEDLKEWILKDESHLRQIEVIVHPLVRKEAENQKKLLQAQGEKMAFYEIPLLFEKKLESQFDRVVLVDAEEAVRKERLLKKRLKKEHIEKIMSLQAPLEETRKKAHFVLKNNGPKEAASRAD